MNSSTSIDWSKPSGLLARVLLAALGGALLCLPCVDFNWYPVGWVGFVPILYAIRDRSLKETYLLGAVAGIVFWAGLSYWMADFAINLKDYKPPYNVLAAAAFWLYAGQLFGIVLLLYQWLRDRIPVSGIFILPVVFVTVFSLYPTLFYMHLGEGQTGFPLAIQGADITGAVGIDFIMVMTSAAVFALIMQPGDRSERASAAVAGILLLTWFGYGYLSLSSWDREIASWDSKRIGIVQPNDVPSIPIPPPAPGYSRAMPPEMEMTERLARQGAEFVAWPEARFKGYFEQAVVRDAFHYSVSTHGAAVLFHDLEKQVADGQSRQYNTAALLDQSGAFLGSYRKMKRFAFGEYAPLISEIPLLRKWVVRYFGDFLQEITPGEGHLAFDVAGMRIVPKICYESSFPIFLADSVVDDPQGKMIVLLSQDGWFGETRQPFQHLWQSAVRAVENRVPIVHVINNGPSGIILPSGRYAFRSTPFVRSETVVDMPYSAASGGSFFSRHPRLFIGAVYAACLFFVGWSLLLSRSRYQRNLP